MCEWLFVVFNLLFVYIQSPSSLSLSDDDKGWSGNRGTPSSIEKVPWSDPLQDQMSGSLESDFQGMNMGQKMPPPNGNPQWGRAEINQATPWDLDSGRGAAAAAGGGFPPEGMPGRGGPGFMPQGWFGVRFRLRVPDSHPIFQFNWAITAQNSVS